MLSHDCNSTVIDNKGNSTDGTTSSDDDTLGDYIYDYGDYDKGEIDLDGKDNSTDLPDKTVVDPNITTEIDLDGKDNSTDETTSSFYEDYGEYGEYGDYADD